jgi:spore maturation protein CgeB
MARYQLTINIHGDQVQNIGNMRLTEAGGVGTCQLIDWKPNAETYFKPDEEAVFFRTVDELKSKVRYLLEHPEETRKIGEAAQKRVLREYTFAAHVSRFMHEVRAFLG